MLRPNFEIEESEDVITEQITHRLDDRETITEVHGSDDRETITEEEVKEAINRLKNGKAAGHDNVKAEMIKTLGESGIKILTAILNKAWNLGSIPTDWEVGIIILIFKKGNARDCKNYRGITLLSIASKVYERVIESKLLKKTDKQMLDSQSGFRKGYSTQDHIFSIKEITHKLLEQKQEAYIAFLDLEKAFDCISRKKIWCLLRERNVGKKITNAIESMYKVNQNYVRIHGMQSQEFNSEQGLRQGSVLSPILFNIVMDQVMKESRERSKKLFIGYTNMQRVGISECAFADDLAIFANSQKALQQNLDIWNSVLKSKNMKTNTEKSKVMVIAHDDLSTQVHIDGHTVEQVNEFKYLGCVLDSKGKHEIEVNERINAAAKLYHALNKSFISKKEVSSQTKIKVFKTIFRPVLLWGSESWVLSKRLKSHIQAMEMKYLRRVKGVTRADKIRNDVIRSELEVEPALKIIEQNQLKWFGHLQRLNDKRQVKKVWKTRTMPKRNRGRPIVTWNKMLEDILEQRGTTLQEARQLAQDKKKWSKFVYDM